MSGVLVRQWVVVGLGVRRAAPLSTGRVAPVMRAVLR
jgi:hypothetical protein